MCVWVAVRLCVCNVTYDFMRVYAPLYVYVYVFICMCTRLYVCAYVCMFYLRVGVLVCLFYSVYLYRFVFGKYTVKSKSVVTQ